MKDFSIFLLEGDVKRQHPDRNLSEELANDCMQRLEYAKASDIDENTAKYVYENIYESLREAADSILFIHGFKSFSHEATISFLQQFKSITAKEIAEFDRMRIKRNGMKYYGKSCSIKEAQGAIKFTESLIKKLLETRKRTLK